MNRHDVLDHHAKRMKARHTLIGEMVDARRRLSPTLLWKHWKLRQIERLADSKDTALSFTKNNAVIMGGALGLAALIAAGWHRIAVRRKDKNAYNEDQH
jgi:hypothetical protein